MDMTSDNNVDFDISQKDDNLLQMLDRGIDDMEADSKSWVLFLCRITP